MYTYWVEHFTTSSENITQFIPYNAQTNEIALPKAIHISIDSETLKGEKEYNGRNSDSDRILHHIAAYNSIKDKGFLKSIFGYGWYKGARYEMIDDSLIIRQKHGLSIEHLTNGKPLQATAAAAILVDTGFFGVFLVLMNGFLVIISIMKCKDPNKYIISLIYLTLILVLFIGNPTPLLLFWVLLMPNNPIFLMLKQK